MQQYAAALPFYEGMDERERGPADELLWQAAAALVRASALQAAGGTRDAAASTTSSGGGMAHLLQALLVLEAGAKGRPYCAPVRLGLAGLHGLLGNAAAACRHFAALEVKHVQHDTLSSHHLLPLLLGLGAAPAASKLLASTCALFEDHTKDAGDTLMQAFTHGSYTKVCAVALGGGAPCRSTQHGTAMARLCAAAPCLTCTLHAATRACCHRCWSLCASRSACSAPTPGHSPGQSRRCCASAPQHLLQLGQQQTAPAAAWRMRWRRP
jgi:hypothetical protein